MDGQQQALRILTEADQRLGLFALVHQDDRDLLPFTAKSPGDYLTWLLIAAGRAEEAADGDPCDNGDEAQMEGYHFALACYKYAIDLLLAGARPTIPADIQGAEHLPRAYRGHAPLLIKASFLPAPNPPGTRYHYQDPGTGRPRWTAARFVGWTARDAIFPEHCAILVGRHAVQFLTQSALLPGTRALLPAPPEDERAYAYGCVAPGVA